MIEVPNRPRPPRAILQRGGRFACAVLAAVGAVIAPAAAAGTDTAQVTVEASAPGSGGPARAQAIAEAQRQAVVDTLESMLATADFTAVAPLIDHAAHYVHSFRLLDQRQEDRGTWVEIEVEIRKSALRRDAVELILPQLSEIPSVLVYLAEAVGEPGESPQLQQGHSPSDELIAEFLRENGLDVLTAREIADYYGAGELRQYFEAGADGMALLGRIHQTDTVLTGVVHHHSKEGAAANVRANDCIVELKLVRSSDGAVMEEFDAKATVHSIDPNHGGAQAREDACYKVRGEVLVGAVLGALNSNGGDGVLVTVEGLWNEEVLEELVRLLLDDVGADDVDVLYYSPEHTRIQADYEGCMAFFTDTLTTSLLSGHRLRAPRVVARDVLLQVRGAE